MLPRTLLAAAGLGGFLLLEIVIKGIAKRPDASVAGVLRREQRMWMVGGASATHRLHPALAEEAGVGDPSCPTVCLKVHSLDARRTLVQAEVQPIAPPARHPRLSVLDIKR